MKKIPQKILTFEELIETDKIHRLALFILSFAGIILYFISLLVMIFYVKKVVFIKSKSFSFILLNSITNLFELTMNRRNLYQFKYIIIYISYVVQFNLIISSINNILSGKQIFKTEKDFSLKKLIYIKIILPLIIFPYSKFYKDEKYINFFQYITIIILSICLYEYIRNKILQVIKYIEENNNKDNIQIAFMEPSELSRIYIIIKKLWSVNFIFILIYYIIKFFDILLDKIDNIHYALSIILIILKESVVFLYFLVLTTIIYLLNKSYNKGQIIQTEDEDNNNNIANGQKIVFEGEEENNKINKKDELNKIEIEMEDVNAEKNKKSEEYKNLEKAQNEDNVIEIDNADISNGKENKNNDEERLDEEDDNIQINEIINNEIDKLK